MESATANDQDDNATISAELPEEVCPLASLTPEKGAEGVFVKAVVSLIWPYSPSSSTMRLVLSEEDFRLRGNKGQLRVSFHGACAKQLATRNISIGDKLIFSTEGARFRKLEKGLARDVPWSLRYDNRLSIKFESKGGWSSLEIDEIREVGNTEETTESVQSSTPRAATPLSSFSDSSQREWKTPISFKRQAYTSQSPEGSIFGSLFDEVDLEEEERSRKKPRFTRTRYRLVARSESPEPAPARESQPQPRAGTNQEGNKNSSAPEEPLEIDKMNETEDIAVNNQAQLRMLPPPVPAIHTEEEEPQVPDSPNLRPVDSSGLPLVSPLEYRGFSFSDYMESRPDLKHMHSDSRLSLATEVSDMSINGDAIDSREDSASSGKDSLFNDNSPTPDIDGRKQENTSLNEAPQSSPLRNIESPSSYLKHYSFLTEDVASNKPPTETEAERRARLSPPDFALPKLVLRPEMIKGITAKPPAEEDTPSKNLKGKEAVRRQSAPLSKIGSPLNVFFGRSKRNLREHASVSSSLLLPPMTRDTENLEEPVVAVEEIATNDEGAGTNRAKVEISELTVTKSTPEDGQTLPQSTSTTSQSQSSSLSSFRSGITTRFSDFPPLCLLCWNTITDLIGVVARSKPIQRAKKGPRDYYTSIRIIDPSHPLGMTVSIFRPYKDALPVVEPGDCMLLRNFKTISADHVLLAQSTNTSSYLVWKDHGRGRPGIAPGPPVEYGEEENEYAARLGRWYEELEESVKEDLLQWPEKSGAKSRRAGMGDANGVEGEEGGESTRSILSAVA
ncbi:hypothetical protein BDZ91DRAFT_851479 [Kalaharituber pfeilii]|nr:hypothetical protein BDZ91DRAFT_851479 [Kalaharituber pfeilii]